jgi:hypothetical protein
VTPQNVLAFVLAVFAVAIVLHPVIWPPRRRP